MKTLILGAGPAGLAAAYTLAGQGDEATILEKTNRVGGICRTVSHQGNVFDLGGHRFFTKFDEVQALWEEVLGEEFLLRPRMSRIYYRGAFFDYPLRATNALRGLGPVESARCMASYGRSRFRPKAREETFEDWVSNRFGRRLFDIFFRTYTEKVWGIPTSEIGAEWAAQRIKNLDLSTAVRDALLRPLITRGLSSDGRVVTSLIEEFHYPRRGPGQMYDVMAEKTTARGGKLLLEHKATRLECEGKRIQRVWAETADGKEQSFDVDHVLSSMPLTLLVEAMEPAAPPEVIRAARSLRFRNLLTVDLLVDQPDLFPDTWIYIHEPGLKVGRIQNFKNWSPDMVADPSTTSLGLEYFCWDNDEIWNASEEELVSLATRELRQTGLLNQGKVLWGVVQRVPKAYPMYQAGYESHLDIITEYIRSFENLQAMGRYGMFKYNNADHSILTALLSVENIGGAAHDVWSVNTDTEYQEIRRS